MSVNKVLKKYQSKISSLKLTIKPIVEEDGKSELILIEGKRSAILFLSDLLRAIADDKYDDGFAMSPKGAGRAYLSKNSKQGLYIHCLNSRGRRRKSPS